MIIKQKGVKMKLNLTFLIFILSINTLLSQNLATSSFDTEWLKSIVSIELINPDGSGAPIGTGFFLTINLDILHYLRILFNNE